MENPKPSTTTTTTTTAAATAPPMTIGHARGRDAKVTLSVALATTTTTTTTTTAATTATTTKRSSGSRTSLIPPRWESSVRTVGMSECREAALSLAHAFAGDAYAQYLVVDDDAAAPEQQQPPPPSSGESSAAAAAEDRWKLHVDIMTYAVAAHCLSGLVTTIGPDYDSVALWLPPGRDLDGWWTTLRSGMWRLYFQLSAEGRRRYYDEILPLLHDTKEQVLGGGAGGRSRSAWYLVYLGTRPNSRGRGYARRLLEDMIQRADAENRPMYLESSALANNAYYEKFGFEVKRDIELKRGAVPVRLSIMVREPRQQQPHQPHQPQPPQIINIERKVVAAAAAHQTTTTTTTANANTNTKKNRTNKIQLVKMG